MTVCVTRKKVCLGINTLACYNQPCPHSLGQYHANSISLSSPFVDIRLLWYPSRSRGDLKQNALDVCILFLIKAICTVPTVQQFQFIFVFVFFSCLFKVNLGRRKGPITQIVAGDRSISCSESRVEN